MGATFGRMEFTRDRINEEIECLRRVARDARANRELKVALEIERGPLPMWEARLAASSASRSS